MKTRQQTSHPTLILSILAAIASASQVATSAPAATAAPNPVAAVIDAGKTYARINPNLYGMFIEHAGGLVYSKMWSEMLDDRKFHNAITPLGAVNSAADDARGAGVGKARRGGGPGGFRTPPRRWTSIGPAECITMDAQHAYAWNFHEMFRHSDIYQLATLTFVTGTYTEARGQAGLNPTGMLFKFYRDRFGTIPVEVSGNSPQPKPKDPPGGEQPVVHAGSDTFPLDVVAAWTADRKALTVAVINPTESPQRLNLQIRGADLSGKGTLRRMAPSSLAVPGTGEEPSVKIEELPVDEPPAMPTFPPLSVSIYELHCHNDPARFRSARIGKMGERDQGQAAEQPAPNAAAPSRLDTANKVSQPSSPVDASRKLKNAAIPSAGCGKELGEIKSGTHTMTSAGLKRQYTIDIPANYDKNRPYRLVFAMHMMGGHMKTMVNNKFYGLKTCAERDKVPCIFVAPEGYSDRSPWRMRDDKDHVFFADMLTLFKDKLSVDTSRIFCCGFSFGGMVTYSLSLDFQKDLRAVACYAPANWNIYLPTNKHERIAFFSTTGTTDGTCRWINSDARKQGGKYCVLIHLEDNGVKELPEIPLATTATHVTTKFKGLPEEYPVLFGSFVGGHTDTVRDPGSNVNWIAEETWDFFMRF